MTTGARTGSLTRRDFLLRSGLSAVSCVAWPRLHAAAASPLANPVGYSHISWPSEELLRAFETISALGYQGVQLLGYVQEAYAGGKTTELKENLQKLKLDVAALSCVKVKLRPDSPEMFTAQFRTYAGFLHDLGGEIMQLTDGGEPRTPYSASEIKSMGARMNELGKMARDADLTVGYHPHVKTIGETREGLGRVLDATDPRYVGLIADVAHLTLGGSDPAEVIRTYRERLVLLHLKDVRKDALDLARQDPGAAAKLKARFCEIGQGVVNFPAVIASLRESSFRGWAIVELDTFTPPPGGPAESARINRDALRALGFKFGG